MAYAVKLYMVLSEDPWRAEKLEEHWFSDWEEARERFLEELERLEEQGYECSDHASAWVQLCSRVRGVRRVYAEELGEELEVVVTEKLLLALEPIGKLAC